VIVLVPASRRAPTPDADRRRRNRRIRELRRAGLSLAAISLEVGVSKPRVVQILAMPDLHHPLIDDPLTAAEAAVRDELDRVLAVTAADRRRIAFLRRQLTRLEEEREAARIDEILGLKG